MSRRSDQLDRIEAALARLEKAAAIHASTQREEAAAVRMEARSAKGSADAALAGVQALSSLKTIPDAAPEPPSGVPQEAGGGTEGEPVTAARRPSRAPKPPKGM